MKLDRLILKKIIKIVATGCQILRLKSTKFDFGWVWGGAPAEIESTESIGRIENEQLSPRPGSWI